VTFYRVEIGSIGRCQDQFHVVFFHPGEDFLFLMRTEIVADDIETFF
jgi:hypothetical protein